MSRSPYSYYVGAYLGVFLAVSELSIIFQILGFLLNWGLYGALCAQVCESEELNHNVHAFFPNGHLDFYYLAFPEDRTSNKVLVYGVYVLETTQALLLLSGGVYIAKHQKFGGSPYELPSKYGLLVWAAIPLLGGFGMVWELNLKFVDLLFSEVAFLVQSFYAYRLDRKSVV